MESILRTLRRAASSFRRFRRAEEGSYLVYVALSAIPMVAAAGLGVDVARGYLAEARLQSAIDAAAIAMGSADGDDDEITTLGRTFFYANFPNDFWAQPTDLNISVTRVDPSDSTSRPESFAISATARVNTLFFRLLNQAGSGVSATGHYDYMDVAASSTALTEVKGLEVVMVLDVTRSMWTNESQTAEGDSERRIEAMRDAALTMVNILFGDIPEPELLKVAVVPYNTVVNIGTNMHQYVENTGLDSSGNPTTPNPFSATTWAGCVQARRNNHDISDDFSAGATDGSGEWEAYRWPIEPDRRYSSSWGYPRPYNYCKNRASNSTGDYYRYDDPGDSFESIESDTWLDSAIPPNVVSGDREYDRYTNGPNDGCPGALLPLTNNRADVWNYIQNDINIADGNGTITAVGLQWGWRVVSPGAPFTEARPYDDIDWEKVIIVLTDGEQLLSSQNSRCDNAPYVTPPAAEHPPEYVDWIFDPADRDLDGTDERNMGGNRMFRGPRKMWTAYGYVDPNDSATLGTGNSEVILENRLGATCDAIKAVEDPINGGPAIDIFAITFGDSVPAGGSIATMMSDCTTDPLNNYFHAPNTDTLNAAFEEIARQLTSLRLTD